METAFLGNGWEGRVVEGRFPLLQLLGGSLSCGSFLTVLPGLQEAVIQLILTGGAEADLHIAQRDFARALSHPHLEKVFAAGRCVIDRSDLEYVVIERSHTTLSKIIRTEKLEADRTREIFIPVLNALSYLHENAVVHGYINPSNIQFIDSEPKLSVTDLLIAGSVKRSIPSPGNYDAPELLHGEVTAAADTWSVGMTLWEAMTQAPPSWDSGETKEPQAPESLPGPFREIVRDCLRVDPFRRCTIQTILERLEESRSIRLSDGPTSVKVGSPLPAAPPVPASKSPTPEELDAFSTPAEKFTEESSEPALFSRSLTPFEETRLSRFRVMPYAVVLLAVIALISVLLFRGQRSRTPSAVANQKAPAISPRAPQTPSAAPAPSVSNQTEPETSRPVSKTQPESAPETQPSGVAQTETQSAPALNQPAPKPPSVPDHAPAEKNAEGLIVKRVLPDVSPGARGGMRRPVDVLIRVSVNQQGTVSDAAYVSPGPGNYFARLAQRAAQAWEFRPPIRNGIPERSVWALRFKFGRGKTLVTATEETK